MAEQDKKEVVIDELEKTEEDREFYRLHTDPRQMEIDQRILGRMAPLSFMDACQENDDKTEVMNLKSIFEVDGLAFFANGKDIE